jgi:hypothetical protein
MASPMREAGLWNPKAIRVMTLILVFTDSIRPLLSPCVAVLFKAYAHRIGDQAGTVNEHIARALGGLDEPGA